MKNLKFAGLIWLISLAFSCKKEEIWSTKFIGIYEGQANCGSGDVPGNIVVSAQGDDNLVLTCLILCQGDLIQFSGSRSGDRSFSLSGECDNLSVNGSGSISDDGKQIIIVVNDVNGSACNASGTKP